MFITNNQLPTIHSAFLDSDIFKGRELAAADNLPVDDQKQLDHLEAFAVEIARISNLPLHSDVPIAVRDSYFTMYAEAYAREQNSAFISASNSGYPDQWPLNHVNWDSAANELKEDFEAVDFDGVTYWVEVGPGR